MRGRPTKDPHTRPAINTLERLHIELGGQISEQVRASNIMVDTQSQHDADR